jgi:hypothetical protein
MASASGATISGAFRGSLVWLSAIGFWLKLLSAWLLDARLLPQASHPGRALVSTFTMRGAIVSIGKAIRRLRKHSRWRTPTLLAAQLSFAGIGPT